LNVISGELCLYLPQLESRPLTAIAAPMKRGIQDAGGGPL
jgi:hypothetical protein